MFHWSRITARSLCSSGGSASARQRSVRCVNHGACRYPGQTTVQARGTHSKPTLRPAQLDTFYTDCRAQGRHKPFLNLMVPPRAPPLGMATTVAIMELRLSGDYSANIWPWFGNSGASATRPKPYAVEGLGHRPHPQPQPVGSCPVLVRRQVQLLPVHLVATRDALADPYVVPCHFLSGKGGQFGPMGKVDVPLHQFPATHRAGVAWHLHGYWRLGDRLRWRGLTVAEGPSAGLSSRTLRPIPLAPRARCCYVG
jgi:hypothetical protein